MSYCVVVCIEVESSNLDAGCCDFHLYGKHGRVLLVNCAIHNWMHSSIINHIESDLGDKIIGKDIGEMIYL